MENKSWFKRFWDFDVLFTPTLIKIFMIIGILGCMLSAIFGAYNILEAINRCFGWIPSGVWLFILGPLFVRFWAELIMICFKIAENTKELLKK